MLILYINWHEALFFFLEESILKVSNENTVGDSVQFQEAYYLIKWLVIKWLNKDANEN